MTRTGVAALHMGHSCVQSLIPSEATCLQVLALLSKNAACAHVRVQHQAQPYLGCILRNHTSVSSSTPTIMAAVPSSCCLAAAGPMHNNKLCT